MPLDQRVSCSTAGLNVKSSGYKWDSRGFLPSAEVVTEKIGARQESAWRAPSERYNTFGSTIMLAT
ncbi:hypothetical protein, partial [Rhodomicrobium vannielii]|uniref:hypothetical protein n=1 Tax=Rhodomicrobium vannielii TaxID=1069 RepID=UPI001AEE4E9E